MHFHLWAIYYTTYLYLKYKITFAKWLFALLFFIATIPEYIYISVEIMRILTKDLKDMYYY